MRVALDTSVIVAALVEQHPQHASAAFWLRTRSAKTRIASAHAFAETWAVLTSMPLDPPVSGQVALTALTRLERIVRFVPARQRVYRTAAARCASLGLRSGAIYDALHLVTAEFEGADALLTFNERDFARLVAPDGPRILVPSDPPHAP